MVGEGARPALTFLPAADEVLQVVDRDVGVRRQVALALGHQEGVDLSLRLSLARELRGGDRLLLWDLAHGVLDHGDWNLVEQYL